MCFAFRFSQNRKDTLGRERPSSNPSHGTFMPAFSMIVAYAARSCFSDAS